MSLKCAVRAIGRFRDRCDRAIAPAGDPVFSAAPGLARTSAPDAGAKRPVTARV
jgi:hypothetical protein